MTACSECRGTLQSHSLARLDFDAAADHGVARLLQSSR